MVRFIERAVLLAWAGFLLWLAVGLVWSIGSKLAQKIYSLPF